MGNSLCSGAKALFRIRQKQSDLPIRPERRGLHLPDSERSSSERSLSERSSDPNGAPFCFCPNSFYLNSVQAFGSERSSSEQSSDKRTKGGAVQIRKRSVRSKRITPSVLGVHRKERKRNVRRKRSVRRAKVPTFHYASCAPADTVRFNSRLAKLRQASLRTMDKGNMNRIIVPFARTQREQQTVRRKRLDHLVRCAWNS